MYKSLRQILALVSVLLLSLTASESAVARGKLLLTMPDLDWALEIDCPTFMVEKGEFNPNDSTRQLLASDQNTGVIMSIFVEPAPGDGDKNDCRTYYWRQAKTSLVTEEDVVFSEQGEKALVEYMIKRFRGARLDQKHMNIYMVKDGFWIDIHLSKVNYRESDRRHFDKVLASTRIIDDYVQTATDNFLHGSYFYMRGDLGKAITYYEKALRCNSDSPSLEHDLWRITVDNLAVAYGMSGDLANSERLLLEAIAQDPSYPMFYYNLACSYAEMGDKNNAIANLRKAYKHKDNMLAGEELPDPRRDLSFRLLLDDPTFVTVLTDLER